MKLMGNNSSVESNISHQPNALEEFYSIALAKVYPVSTMWTK